MGFLYSVNRGEREAEIQSNFSCTIDFWYPCTVNELDDLLEEFKQIPRKNPSAKKNAFGEKVECDRLIVLDDFSGLADDSKKFASFLTVARKYAYNCVYIFHSIQSEKLNWRTILSQTNIYNIFPASIYFNSVKNIIEGACIRKTSKYIPQSAL